MTNTHFTFMPIGVVESCFKEKFGIPRQPGLAPSAKARILFYPPFDNLNAFDGLAGCSHLWVQFVFHKTKISSPWRPKVRPPRMGGNKSLGVFASRSPNRPNPIGLSVVKNEGLQSIQNALYLNVSGIDLLDGTPVLDIKPYVPYVDNIASAVNTFADTPPIWLDVNFTQATKSFCDQYQNENTINIEQLIVEVLRQDPRPSYQVSVTDRVYGVCVLNVNIQWVYKDAARGAEIWVENISIR